MVLPAISERTLEAEAEPLAQFCDFDKNVAHLSQVNRFGGGDAGKQ